jgi:hypothetical protein
MHALLQGVSIQSAIYKKMHHKSEWKEYHWYIKVCDYNLDSSLTVPILSLGAYFFNTLSLWYCVLVSKVIHYMRFGASWDQIKGPSCDESAGSEAGGTETQRAAADTGPGKTRVTCCPRRSSPLAFFCVLSITYLPELLASILSTHSLQDLCATWVLIHKRVHLVYIAIDYYVQALFDCVVLGDLLGGQRLGHGGLVDAFQRRRRDGNGGFGRGTSAFEERDEVATVAFG